MHPPARVALLSLGLAVTLAAGIGRGSSAVVSRSDFCIPSWERLQRLHSESVRALQEYRSTKKEPLTDQFPSVLEPKLECLPRAATTFYKLRNGLPGRLKEYQVVFGKLQALVNEVKQRESNTTLQRILHVYAVQTAAVMRKSLGDCSGINTSLANCISGRKDASYQKHVRGFVILNELRLWLDRVTTELEGFGEYKRHPCRCLRMRRRSLHNGGRKARERLMRRNNRGGRKRKHPRRW
uniref:uncharacterized protein n=1 Tax=Myxine glutinosa TaxID=7769 RepID=UPI00358E6EA3